MEKNVLFELYFNKLSPWEHKHRMAVGQEERENNQKIEDEECYFKKNMSEDDRKRFNDLIERYGIDNDFEDYHAFCYGFRLATQLIIESAFKPVE